MSSGAAGTGRTDADSLPSSATAVPAGAAAAAQTKAPVLAAAGRHALAWSADDALALRRARVCMAPVGTLACVPQQNVFLGLPVLVSRDWVPVAMRASAAGARVVDDHAAHIAPTADGVAVVQERRDTVARDADARAYAAAAANAAAHQRPPPEPSTRLRSVAPPARASAGLPWYDADPAKDVPVHPDQVRDAIVQAIWDRGLHSGPGARFGTDLLVYPGDTGRYHAHFACSLVGTADRPLRVEAIVAAGRLATAVRKAHLFAGWDGSASPDAAPGADPVHECVDLPGRPIFLSLEWARFG